MDDLVAMPEPALSALLLGFALLFAASRLGRVWQAAQPLKQRRAASTVARPAGVLPAIRARRSIFPKSYVDRAVPPEVLQQLLDAAMWAPYHGPQPPWHYCVLGKEAMVAMQRATLEFYDRNWRQTGWANGIHGTEAEYLEWRAMTEGEITGRWAPVSYMVMVVMRRQAGDKRIPEWEEAAAVAASVQNMHIQAGAWPWLACYWSSWHEAFRDSAAMQQFLKVGPEDRCLGAFIVAACSESLKDRRVRDCRRHTSVEWRR